MIKDKIEILCKEKNISIRAVEMASNLSNGSIGKWNEADPGARKLKAVADYFGVSIDFFLTDEKEGDE